MDKNSKQHRYRHKKIKFWRFLLISLSLFFIVDALVIYRFYSDAKQAVDSTYTKVGHRSGRTSDVNFNNGQPFSILLLGVDTGEYGRTYQGRSDTIMVAAVNPKTKTTTLASLPRDTKVAIPGHGFNNKLNAAYSYDGVGGAMNTVQSYLGVPIDHYIEMNMKGLVQLSSALGSVRVENDLEFTNLGYHFKKGTVKINKDNILAYTRMRYQDSRGDYGRQMRQRLVLEQLLGKMTSLKGITNYQNVLSAISSNMKTDLTFNQMKTIATKYRKAGNVKQLQLKGTGSTINGVSYEVVSKANLTKLTQQLKNALDLN